MKPTRKLWTWLVIVFVMSFAVLGWIGREIYLAAPPIPEVQTAAGSTLYTADEIQRGQQAWLTAGGQQLGSVWGHGSYVAPDWSADWLHREAVALGDALAESAYRTPYELLQTGEKAAIDVRVMEEMRRNTYDAERNVVTISAERARAIAEVQAHYEGVFGDAPTYATLRERYAMPENALPRVEDRKALAPFVVCSAW